MLIGSCTRRIYIYIYEMATCVDYFIDYIKPVAKQAWLFGRAMEV